MMPKTAVEELVKMFLTRNHKHPYQPSAEVLKWLNSKG